MNQKLRQLFQAVKNNWKTHKINERPFSDNEWIRREEKEKRVWWVNQ